MILESRPELPCPESQTAAKEPGAHMEVDAAAAPDVQLAAEARAAENDLVNAQLVDRSCVAADLVV